MPIYTRPKSDGKIYTQAMFKNHNISTLQVIEAHIRNLEYAYMVVGSSQSLLIELGNAYKAKNELLKQIDNDSFSKHYDISRITFSSKLNQVECNRKVRIEQACSPQNRAVS